MIQTAGSNRQADRDFETAIMQAIIGEGAGSLHYAAH